MSSKIIEFTIDVRNIFQPSAEGPGSAYIPRYTLVVPPNIFTNPPQYLEDLIIMVGSENVRMDWYVQASGWVSKMDCDVIYELKVWGNSYYVPDTSHGTSLDAVVVAHTDHINRNAVNLNGDYKLLLGNTEQIIRELYSDDDCTELGFINLGQCSYCRFPSFGGWKDTWISARVVVRVNMYDYCLANNRIYDDPCYDYIGTYIISNGSDENIDKTMATYCDTKYPGATLEIFNDPNAIGRDFNICACNMPQKNYDEYYASLQTYYPDLDIGDNYIQCMYPQCVNSHFKPSPLGVCDAPQCMTVVSTDGNDIEGTIYINTTVNCEEYGITAPSDGTIDETIDFDDIDPDDLDPDYNEPIDQGQPIYINPTSPPYNTIPVGPAPPPVTPPSTSSTPTPDTDSSNYLWWLLGIFLLVIILLIIGGVVFYFFTRNTDSNTITNINNGVSNTSVQ